MNQVIIVAILAVVIAQILKCPIYYLKNNKWDLSIVLSTGSMPSSHTSLVVATAFEVGKLQGFDSAIFGLAFVFAGVTIHDAVKVRGESGKQAQVINKISNDLKTITEVMNVKIDQEQRTVRLKELIGHNTNEVIIGFLTGILVFLIYNSI